MKKYVQSQANSGKKKLGSHLEKLKWHLDQTPAHVAHLRDFAKRQEEHYIKSLSWLANSALGKHAVIKHRLKGAQHHMHHKALDLAHGVEVGAEDLKKAIHHHKKQYGLGGSIDMDKLGEELRKTSRGGARIT